MNEIRVSRDFRLAVVIIAIAAVTLFGYVAAIRRQSSEEGTYVPKDVMMTPEIAMLQRYVRVDTSNPPGNETRGAEFLRAILEERGIASELIESSPGRGNLYARIRGRREGEGLLLLHHIDVVPANPKGWNHSPFKGEIALNMLWGRGSLDMKGIGICHLAAFLDVARSGRQPERDLVFLATADEESGGVAGVRWLLEHRPDIFEGVKFALNEGGVTEMSAEQIVYFAIEIGSKQFIGLRLRSSSRELLREVRIALEPYFAPHDPDVILPEIKKYFAAIAPTRKEHAHLLRDVDAAIAAGQFWNLPDPYRALTQNRLWAGGVRKHPHAGWQLSVVLQNLPNEDPETRIEHFKSLLPSDQIDLEIVRTMGRLPIASTESELYEILVKQVRREYGDVPVGPHFLGFGSTDSRYLRTEGIEAYGLWPFPADFFQSQGIHGIDERVRLDWFIRGVGMTKRVVHSYVD